MHFGWTRKDVTVGRSICHQAWPGPSQGRSPSPLPGHSPGHEGKPDACSEPWAAWAQEESAVPLAIGSRRDSRAPVECLDV